ncbi:hypothetical protein FQA47_010724 [Oryzias melastigma]|uniref:Uncharacterized protein n=1 Tax=Oryzias melastigma TaxID=30732 RepID=A0A834C711_ORYME|nr:hypothetical protein FQA47_010724 [Oryzias melastigma]
MDPQAATSPAAAAAAGLNGRLASLGADGGDSESGAGSDDAAVGCCSDTFSSLPDMEQESLEEKLRGLAFRKQTSYRGSRLTPRRDPAAVVDGEKWPEHTAAQQFLAVISENLSTYRSIF